MAKIEGVYKDKKTNLWYYVASLGFDSVTGKRIQKKKSGFRTQAAANQAKIEVIREYHEMGKIAHANMKYKLFMNEIYIPDYKARVEETTFESREPAFKKMEEFFGDKNVRQITALDVQRWKNYLIKTYSQNYARLVFGMFRKSLDLAVSLSIIPKNVSKNVDAITKAKNKVAFWSKGEFERVLETFSLNDYYEHYSFVMIWTYFMTGVRVNEGTALCWSRDIDLENKTLSVQYSLRYKNKQKWEFGPTKTKAAVRTISIDDDTIGILKEWKARQQQFGNMDFVFSYDGMPTSKSTLNHIVKRHGKLAGVEQIQPKGLRHSHASLLINEYNMNPLIIKDRLGHEDIKTTLGTYGHLYNNVNHKVASLLKGTIAIKTAKEKQTKFQGNQNYNSVEYKKME